MTCINCDINKPSRVTSICRCCQLVDGDETQKAVWFCSTCDVYLCKECWNNKSKRGHAAILHAANKFITWITA